MPDSIYGRVEYHPWPYPTHNLTNLLTFFWGIAMGGAILASGLTLAILAMVETATSKLCQMLIFIRHCVLLQMMTTV